MLRWTLRRRPASPPPSHSHPPASSNSKVLAAATATAPHPGHFFWRNWRGRSPYAHARTAALISEVFPCPTSPPPPSRRGGRWEPARKLASAMAHDAGDSGGELPPPAKKKSPAEEEAEKRSVPVRPPRDSEAYRVGCRILQFRHSIGSLSCCCLLVISWSRHVSVALQEEEAYTWELDEGHHTVWERWCDPCRGRSGCNHCLPSPHSYIAQWNCESTYKQERLFPSVAEHCVILMIKDVWNFSYTWLSKSPNNLCNWLEWPYFWRKFLM